MGMVMKFSVKKHFTFADLESRWACSSSDLIQAVIDGELIPSIHLDGKYELKIFTADHSVESELQLESVFNGDDPIQKGRIGFHYLICPLRTEVADCKFSCFSDQATGHDEGDVCFELSAPISMAYVQANGVFMLDEVARVEAISVDSSTGKTSKEPRPLATKERDTLLTIIAALAKHGKIAIKDRGKSAEFISGLTNEIGAHVAKRTIEEHLRKIPSALEVRMK